MSKADGTTPCVNIRLRSARMKKRWNVSFVAHKLEVSESTYTRWEQGKQSPQLPNLDRLCEVFETTPRALGYGELLGERDVESEAGYQLELTRRLDRLHKREVEVNMREKDAQVERERIRMLNAQLKAQTDEIVRERERLQKEWIRWEVLEQERVQENERQQRLLSSVRVSPGDGNQ